MSYIRGKTGTDMAIRDFERDKLLFDKSLKNHEYDVLTSIVWSFDGFSNFAASGVEAPMMDFSGKIIQDLTDPDIPVQHIYLSVFSENEKTYAIIAWFKQFDNLFSFVSKKLSQLSVKEKKAYINTTIPIISENVVIRPSSWDRMDEQAKVEFEYLFRLSNDIEASGIKINRFLPRTFDLFSI